MKKTYEYENVQIGNFLMSIGYYLRDLDYGHPVAVSLNQQTPNDPSLGDLFGSFMGRSFLIEFKSHEKNLSKEYEKPARQKLLKKLKSEKYLNEKSTSILSHFLCYPEIKIEQGKKNMIYNLRSYIVFEGDKVEIQGVNTLLKAISKDLIGVSHSEMKKYIDLLLLCSSEAGHRDSSGVNSGILMSFNKKEGIIYTQYNSYQELSNDLSIGFSYEEKVEKKIEKNIEITIEAKKVIKKDKDKGMDM